MPEITPIPRPGSLRKHYEIISAATGETMGQQKGHHNPWPEYNSPIEKYEESFREVMTESFYDFLKNRRAQKGQAFYLDVMGTTQLPKNYPVDGQAAISILPHKSWTKRTYDKIFKKKLIIKGNVLFKDPWNKARDFINKHDKSQFKGYDLITCRPLHGWDAFRERKDQVTEDPNLPKWIIFQQMFSLLSPMGGKLYISVRPFDDYSNWVAKLNTQEGINAIYDNNVLNDFGEKIICITKTGNPKGLLPKITTGGTN